MTSKNKKLEYSISYIDTFIDSGFDKIYDKVNPVKFDDLTKSEQAAIAIGTMNNQVYNGGFTQWVDNGYALDYFDCILDVLNEFSTKESKQLMEILHKIGNHIYFSRESHGHGNYWNIENEYSMFDDEYYEEQQYLEDQVMNEVDAHSESYYKIRDAILIQLAAYIELIEIKDKVNVSSMKI